MSTDFFGALAEIDRVIEDPSDVSRSLESVACHLADDALRREFFSRLHSPDWIRPLKEGGYFATPAKDATTDGRTVSYARWPESAYLRRMAADAPAEVALIFSELVTDNVSIVGDLVDAALSMPTDVAVKLVPAICRAAKDGTLWIHFKDASDLCTRFAESGQLSDSLVLAESLYTPRFEDGQEDPRDRDEHWYKEGLKEVAPLLAVQDPRNFLPKICDWLTASVHAKKHIDPNTGSDYSFMWRPAIEEHEQNSDYEFAGAMAGIVRDSFEQAIRMEKIRLGESLQILGRHSYLIFKRMKVHLINEFAEQNPVLARQTIMDRELFDDYKFKHEYAMLVGRRIDLLTAGERESWFGWIDKGPDMSDFDELVKANLERDATEADRQSRIRYWQYEKLHWVRDHLIGERAEVYRQMLAERGEPELADLNVRSGPVQFGSESPMTVDDLTAMSFSQAVIAVSSWKTAHRSFGGPDVEGLASTFRQYIATDFEQFSTYVRELMGRPAIYVRCFISEMTEAVKAQREIDISAVLELGRWVVERPLEERTTLETTTDVLVDQDWQWTRDEISDFIQSVCQQSSNAVPKYPLNGLRDRIWDLVSTLAQGRFESYVVRDVSQEDPRVHDYLDLGINSPRGKAVEAALDYGRWVANHVKQIEGSQDVVPLGFDAMPELREMLEWQLVSDNRSLEAMSVIGSRIGLIYWIDKDWLAEHTDQIFPLEEIEKTPTSAEAWAAWNAFLVWVRPHVEFYKIFKDKFAYAVRQSMQVQLPERVREQPMMHLGEHLVVLYGRGQLKLNDDRLLKDFLSSGALDIRRHAIGFAGQSLEGEEKVPAEVLERFRLLWEAYWSDKGKIDAAERPDAWLFGPWFSCGRFDEQWSLARLEEIVYVAPTPEPERDVAKQLARIAHVNLISSIRILDRVMRNHTEEWRIRDWLEPAKQILETAMRTGGTAQEEAVQLIDYLGRRGYTELGRLLP